jgi:hypothetical protein
LRDRITRKFHGIETRFSSLFELHSRYLALPDDGQERAKGQLAVGRDGNGDAAGYRSLPILRFDPRYEDIGPKPTLELFGIATLEEQLDSLSQVGGRLSSTVAPWLATSSSGHSAARAKSESS